jgi:hypothetical protein
MLVTDSPQEAVDFIVASSRNSRQRAKEERAREATRDAFSEGYSAE